MAEKLAEWGHDDFTSYVVWSCERALERGMLPHTNIGVLDRDDLARLREVTASQGLMLESISERLMDTVHAGSPTKHPAQRLATIEAAGELKIPFTSGILVGIGETEQEQVESLEALAELHGRYGHLQEIILQNFVPHPRLLRARKWRISRTRRRVKGGRRAGVPLLLLGFSPVAVNQSSEGAGRAKNGTPLRRRGTPALLASLGELRSALTTSSG